MESKAGTRGRCYLQRPVPSDPPQAAATGGQSSGGGQACGGQLTVTAHTQHPFSLVVERGGLSGEGHGDCRAGQSLFSERV